MRKDKSIKMFTVDTEKTGCRNHSEALKYFRDWRSKYYSDPIEILRIKSCKSYVIYYRLKDKAQRRLD